MKRKKTLHICDTLALIIIMLLLSSGASVYASPLSGIYIPQGVQDQTPAVPLSNPTPSGFAPRYISGFGLDDTFTVFFEDRGAGGAISFIQTSGGVTGFPASPTATNISDTHFVVKNWPWPDVGPVQYLYRGWGSDGNNRDHNFYCSNDLTNWVLISPDFQIPNDPGFTNADGFVFYGFHDVIRIPQSSGPNPYQYYAWAESNGGQTMIVTSPTGGDDWTAIASVGGSAVGDGNLIYPESGTPSGSFFDLGHDRGYGMLQIRGNDSGIYLAVNSEARASLASAAFEAAFADPANWTWHDGTTGLMSTPLLTATGEHDFREAWLVPNSDPDDPILVVYDANYGAADGGIALGYFTINPEEYLAPEPATLPETGFPKNGSTQIDAGLEKQAYSAYSDLRLSIPRLDVEMDILGVPLVEGTWDVSWLGDNAGYLHGTAFPTWAGNTVITGHVWGAYNAPGPFANLKELRFGDEVKIYAWGLVYTYEIREQSLR
jgi:hypothetical protein